MTAAVPPYEVFRWNLVPDGYLTRRQLRERGLRPGGQPVAGEIRWRRGRKDERVAYLFLLQHARPVRPMTPRKQAALDAAMNARRTCPECGVVHDHCIPRRFGRCLACEDADARNSR
jgi:hypothetical protein